MKIVNVIVTSILCLYDYSCNTHKYIKSVDRYGKYVFLVCYVCLWLIYQGR